MGLSTAGRKSDLNCRFTLSSNTTPMLTPHSHKHAALRAVHMAVDGVNIGVVLLDNVNRWFRSDFLPAVSSTAR